MQIDIAGDLSPIAKAAPAIVVDAAGPFQSCGDDPYRVARFCIEHGINYLDLSDDADFTAGITALDEAAKEAGCFALSGVSSVPAISAAAVRALSEGLSELQIIESALAPGNRAPRGRSVTASILSQTGEPLNVWRGGAWRQQRGWSDGKTVSFGPKFKRRASLIGAPDLKLFPQAFGARSVIFRAGLELNLMHRGLAFLGFLRACRLLPKLNAFLAPLLWMSRWLEPFGSDQGAMAVDVTGLEAGRSRAPPLADHRPQRRWSFHPSRARARDHTQTHVRRPGARPCLFDLSLPEIESAMDNLSVEFDRSSSKAPTLFQKALGEKWDALPASVRRLHSVQDMECFSGNAKVTRGRSLIARSVAWLVGFPRAGENIPVTVTINRTPSGETWERNFAGRKFRSHLSSSPRPFHCRERFSVFTYELELPVGDESLFFPVRRGWFLGIPLPSFLLPRSEAREYDVNGVFHFDVALYAPFDRSLIVRYEGYAKPGVSYGPRSASAAG